MSRTTSSIRCTLAAAVALLCSAGAGAQTATVYGLLDASGARVKPIGGKAQYELDSGNLTRSFLGIRGSEDLGGGLRAVFRLETYVRVDAGAAGRFTGDNFWGRESSVGLSGAFGTSVLGRNASPLYLQTIAFNPFGEGFGFSPATRQYFGTTGAMLSDTRWNNSISYTNNTTDAPLRIHFAANLPEEAARTPPPGRNFGTSVAYITGPFAVSFESSASRTLRWRSRRASIARPRSSSARPTTSPSSASTARPAASRRMPTSTRRRPCTSSAPRCRSAPG